MSKRIKVINPHRNIFYVNLKSLNNKVLPVYPNNGFVFLNEEELAYIVNTSKAFSDGFLKVDDKSKEKITEDIQVPESLNAMTDNEVNELVKGNANTLKKKIKEIDNRQTLERILTLAKSEDKPVGTIDAIKERIEEVISE